MLQGYGWNWSMQSNDSLDKIALLFEMHTRQSALPSFLGGFVRR